MSPYPQHSTIPCDFCLWVRRIGEGSVDKDAINALGDVGWIAIIDNAVEVVKVEQYKVRIIARCDNATFVEFELFGGKGTHSVDDGFV